jgi:hypothetical protein
MIEIGTEITFKFQPYLNLTSALKFIVASDPDRSELSSCGAGCEWKAYIYTTTCWSGLGSGDKYQSNI